MPFTTNSSSNERREIHECKPPLWSLYRPSDSTYHHAKPTHCWTQDGIEFIEAAIYSKSRGEVIYVAKWNQTLDEWEIISETSSK